MQSWLLLGMIFATVVLTALALGEVLWVRPRHSRQRLAGDGLAEEPVSPRLVAEGWFHRVVVARLKDRLVPENEVELDGIRLRLLRAGFTAPQAVPAYYVIRLLMGGGLPLLISPLLPLLGGKLGLGAVTAIDLVLAGVAYIAPAIFLDLRVSARQRLIREAFPDCLDLMIICVEAGLGLDGAINRVGQEMITTHPLLSSHLRLLSAELRAGKTREEAWRAMAKRIGLPEIASLVTLLVQTETLGASAADALRAHAAEQRLKRLLQAETKAQQLAVKMTFPLILMILPALMIVIGAPAVIRATHTDMTGAHASR